MRNIAIITARSGSKGLKDKNIKLLNGKPLLAYSIDAAKAAGVFDEIMVSTDSEHYAEIARQYGANVPFLRSAVLSGDTAGSWDVVQEVLQGYLKLGQKFDTVCLLQPTSPMRRAEDIVAGYEMLQHKNADAVTAVCEVDHSPLWSMILPEDGSLVPYRESVEANIPRQKLPKYYRINGALYIRKIGYNGSKVKLIDTQEYALIMARSHSVDIDTIDDFEYAEWMMWRRDN